MAQRFGGKYSPEQENRHMPKAAGAYRGAVRTRAGGRVNFLFIAPLPLIWSAFTSGAVGLALNLSALGLLLLAAWMTREGIKAEEAYNARKVARRPGFPRKIAGSLLTGAGLGLAGFAAGGSVLEPVIYAVTGAVLHSFAFGLDPMSDKGMEGVDSFQTDRVARAVDKAETTLKAMSDAVIRAGDRQSETRVETFQASVREMLRTIEGDPRDLTTTRKYLTVYLTGARDATVKFADIYAHSRDAKAREDYFGLLDDLQENFTAKTRSLLNDDTTDLEVEIDVLRDRLKREGLRPENTT
jgi:hypothetical protein